VEVCHISYASPVTSQVFLSHFSYLSVSMLLATSYIWKLDCMW